MHFRNQLAARRVHHSRIRTEAISQNIKPLYLCGSRPLAGSRSFARQLGRATEPRVGVRVSALRGSIVAALQASVWHRSPVQLYDRAPWLRARQGNPPRGRPTAGLDRRGRVRPRRRRIGSKENVAHVPPRIMEAAARTLVVIALYPPLPVVLLQCVTDDGGYRERHQHSGRCPS